MQKVISILLFILSIGSPVFSEEIPLYKGFPVYPPEKIPSLTEDSFSLDLRSREEILAYVRSTDFVWGKVSGNVKEFDEARQHIFDNTSALGWKKVFESVIMDGGSREYLFAKVIDDSVRLVWTALWSEDMFGPADNDTWGTISYEMKDYPAPVLVEDFPVYAKSNEIEIREDSQSRAKFFEISNNFPVNNSDDYFGPRITFWEIPLLLGWEYYYSPMLEKSEFLYKKGDTYVKAIDLEGNIRIEIYDETVQIDLLRKYPPSREKKKVVEGGCYIYKGRHIRPPYTVELKDNKLCVNGIVWETISPEREMRSHKYGFSEWALYYFDDAVSKLSDGNIRIEHVGSIYSRDLRDIQKLLLGIDEVMKSNVSKEEKEEMLEEVIDTPHMSDEEFNDFLTNWDGIN